VPVAQRETFDFFSAEFVNHQFVVDEQFVASRNVARSANTPFPYTGERLTLTRLIDSLYRKLVCVSDNLVEHEFDHIYAGIFEGSPLLNPKDAASRRWIEIAHRRCSLNVLVFHRTAPFSRKQYVHTRACQIQDWIR
jgi:hypothetical protein